jgi:hypothetical protein
LKPTLDLRPLGSPIKDQGRRGTCVACAATAGHEMLRAEGIDLCTEFLHWGSKRRDGLPEVSEGTTLSAVTDVLMEIGQPPETTWPYDEKRDQWAPNYRPPAAACAAAPKRRLSGVEELPPTSVALRDTLNRESAVLLGIRLHQTWFDVSPTGRIAIPSTGAHDFGGHAVLVVGFDEDALIIQNSWGADWGERGFGYLPDAYVDAHGVAAWALSRR